MREYESPQEELRRRQRSLIPVNIVVALLALVAALSILFLPLLRIHTDNISDLVPAGDGGETTEGSESDPSAMLGDISFSLSLTGMDFVRLGFSGDMMNFVADKVGEVLSSQASTLAASALAAAAESSGAEIDENAVNEIADSLEGLERASGEEEVDTAIGSLVDTLLEYLPIEDGETIDKSELQTQIRDMYDDTVAQTNGEFTLEAFVCVQASSALNENGEGTGEVYTNFSDLTTNLLGTAMGDGETDISETIPKEVMLGIGVAMLVFAGVWAILFLFAFFRIFAKNKRFTMWYVKLLGFIPCLLFGVLPLAAPSLIGAIAGAEATSTVSTIFGMISSLSWVSGACYLLLWLVSIFWAFPIKRKIRRLNKEVR